MILIGLNTGLRRGVIHALKKSYMDFERKRLKLPAEIMKNKRPFEAPMNETIYRSLWNRFGSLKDEDMPYNYDPKKAYKSALKRAGITDTLVNFHTLRHIVRNIFKGTIFERMILSFEDFSEGTATF